MPCSPCNHLSRQAKRPPTLFDHHVVLSHAFLVEMSVAAVAVGSVGPPLPLVDAPVGELEDALPAGAVVLELALIPAKPSSKPRVNLRV